MSTGLLLIIIAAVFFLVAIIYFVFRTSEEEESEIATQFTSGVYAVYRSSPRENINSIKPDKEKLQEYVRTQNEDINSQPLNEEDKSLAIEHYLNKLEENICIIEKADSDGAQNFMLVSGEDCPACKNMKGQNPSVSRKELHSHPELIPPYFPGCDCTLSPISETDSIDVTPLEKDQFEHYDLPNWKNIKKIG